MVAENPTWGAPRIHGELLKLGFDLSEPTGFEMGSASPETCGPHEALADLPSEPSRGHCRHGFLHCADTDLRHSVLLFRDQHRVLHHNATRNPNALWVALQLHEAWECGEQSERFLIFDRDSKFSADVVSTVKAMGSQPVRTAFRSSLAEWNCGALGRQCPSRSPGSCDRAESKTSETVA